MTTELEATQAALLAAQQERDEARLERDLRRNDILVDEARARAERAEETVTRLRKTLAILAECGEVTVEEIARAALAQDTEQEGCDYHYIWIRGCRACEAMDAALGADSYSTEPGTNEVRRAVRMRDTDEGAY